MKAALFVWHLCHNFNMFNGTVNYYFSDDSIFANVFFIFSVGIKFIDWRNVGKVQKERSYNYIFSYFYCFVRDGSYVKHNTLSLCWFNVGPSSATLVYHGANIELKFCVSWVCASLEIGSREENDISCRTYHEWVRVRVMMRLIKNMFLKFFLFSTLENTTLT